jgi:hypothetical protein
MTYTIKGRELKALCQALRRTDVAEIKNDLRKLMDMLVTLSEGHKDPITKDDLIVSLPWMGTNERQHYLIALERAGYLVTCYGGHDSRLLGWKLK